jgi:hypothetical protein
MTDMIVWTLRRNREPKEDRLMTHQNTLDAKPMLDAHPWPGNVDRESLASCIDECERHAEMHEHCRICADACRRCQQACDELLASMK